MYFNLFLISIVSAVTAHLIQSCYIFYYIQHTALYYIIYMINFPILSRRVGYVHLDYFLKLAVVIVVVVTICSVS
jgi:hypothetical protein